MPDFVLENEPDGFARIKVIGVGGGGCNAVDSMFDVGLPNVEFYVVNSDLQALKRSKCPNRIQIGAEKTLGRGCGADPRLGEEVMMEAKDLMMETLHGADLVFVTCGLGGGTGTGAAPVVAQFAKELGILTVSVVTKPFKFEGPRRMKSAESGIERLREVCDTMIVINNERLLESVGPRVPFKEAFQVADNVLSQAVSSISDLVATPGLINVDFNDVRTIMGGKGRAVMGVGLGKGESRAAEAVKKATNSPLLDKVVIDGARGVLICITGGPDMTLQEVSEAVSMVHESADPDAEIIFGAVVDESMSDCMRVTLIATGFADEPPPSGKANFFSERLRNGHSNMSFTSEGPAPKPSAPAPKNELDENPIFAEEKPAPKPSPAPAPAPQNQQQESGESKPSSLRATLEAMMREQNAAEDQPPIRVARSTPKRNGGTNGGGSSPSVRPADSRVRPSNGTPETKPAPSEPPPQVSLFDPVEEEAKEEQKQDDFDTPAFLRRRRSLFE